MSAPVLRGHAQCLCWDPLLPEASSRFSAAAPHSNGLSGGRQIPSLHPQLQASDDAELQSPRPQHCLRVWSAGVESISRPTKEGLQTPWSRQYLYMYPVQRLHHSVAMAKGTWTTIAIPALGGHSPSRMKTRSLDLSNSAVWQPAVTACLAIQNEHFADTCVCITWAPTQQRHASSGKEQPLVASLCHSHCFL